MSTPVSLDSPRTVGSARGRVSQRVAPATRAIAAVLARALPAVLALALAGTALGAGRSLFVCTEPGRPPRMQDHLFTDCAGQQLEKNPDGSTKRVIPKPPTEEERAAAEQRAREEAAQERERAVRERSDRELLKKFPNEGAHAAARREALEAVRASMRITERRIEGLRADRKQLANEEEFYVGKPLPGRLKSLIDANEALLAAQQQLLAGQEQERARVDQRYDQELAHLRELWAARR